MKFLGICTGTIPYKIGSPLLATCSRRNDKNIFVYTQIKYCNMSNAYQNRYNRTSMYSSSKSTPYNILWSEKLPSYKGPVL